MKNWMNIILSTALLYSSCKHAAPKNISDQLRSDFSAHVKSMDSSLVLDSFKVFRIDTMVEKLGRIIDDTIYKIEFHRVQLQLANAIKEQNKDSIAIYQDELDYMAPQIDSVTKAISRGDTTKKMGILAACRFQLRKNDKTYNSNAYYFLDRSMRIINTDMIDSAIAFALRKGK